MTGGWISRGARLEALLEEAFELDAQDLDRFLGTVEPELRVDLARLLKADAESSPLDKDYARLIEAGRLPRDDIAPSAAGQLRGRYRLLRLLGEGGMASVWLAERVDDTSGRQVAVKCLKAGLATPGARMRFLLEQQIMAQLRHPNIARLYEVGSDEVPYIVMELIDGVSLTRWCDERRLGLPERLRLFQKVCAAVACAHQNLIVHRDLKPENILVGRDGEPRLLDFGIAKLLDDSTAVTRTGMHMLTPEYAAPEQFNRGVITTATDGFMLGAVLYELLCGLRPRHFARPGAPTDAAIAAPSEVLRKVGKTTTEISDPLHPSQLASQRGMAPERLRKALRGDLDTIVLKAMQVEPDRRYPTVEALRDDIDRYLRQLPISARKDSRTYRMRKFLRRHAVGMVIGTAVLALLLIATIVSIDQARRAQIETRRAQATMRFLTRLFEISDAGMPRDQMPTTQTLLEDGARRIRGEFADSPEVKFDLLSMLGRIQLHLGQYATAGPLIKEALDIAQARFPPSSEPWLQAHTDWADVMNEQSRPLPAVQWLDAAIATYRHAGGGNSDALVKALIELGDIEARVERFDASVATARQALAMARGLHGERDPGVEEALENLGQLLTRAQKFDEAETVGRADVALSAVLYGQRSAKYAGSLDDLADALENEDKDAEAEVLARKALAIDESVYDRPNEALIKTLGVLDGSLFDQDKMDASEAVLQRWLAVQIQLKGNDDPSVVPVLMNLALVEQRRHDFPQTESLIRHALAIYAKWPGSLPHGMEADGWRTLAEALIQQQRLPEAEAAAQKSLQIDRAAFGSDSQIVGVDLYEQARVATAQGQLRPALELIDASLVTLGKAKALVTADAWESQLQKATILDRLGHPTEAEAILTPLPAPLRKGQREFSTDDRLARILAEMGRAQAGNGDAAAALASWNEALTWQQSFHPTDAKAIADLQTLIAQAHGRTRAK